MKYFEFTTKNFPYYALIGALNEVVAKAFYEETVCDIEDSSGQPEMLTDQGVCKLLNKLVKPTEIAEVLQHLEVDRLSSKPFLILIDGALE